MPGVLGVVLVARIIEKPRLPENVFQPVDFDDESQLEVESVFHVSVLHSFSLACLFLFGRSANRMFEIAICGALFRT
jgi:hypothetical protein